MTLASVAISAWLTYVVSEYQYVDKAYDGGFLVVGFGQRTAKPTVDMHPPFGNVASGNKRDPCSPMKFELTFENTRPPPDHT